MTLSDEYRKQHSWREWDAALSKCPISPGQYVLDLGCGLGNISKILAAKGAMVTGIDNNAELLAIARAECPVSEFLHQDLGDLALEKGSFDGIWCSFAAAYFPNFESIFRKWIECLRDRSWMCLIEMDDLLGHEPLSKETNKRIKSFYKRSVDNGRYDFCMGSKIPTVMRNAGFKVTEMVLNDRELSFTGSATEDVLRSWSNRLDRMSGLKAYLNEEFLHFRNEFLSCLSSPLHRSRCRVICVIGIR